MGCSKQWHRLSNSQATSLGCLEKYQGRIQSRDSLAAEYGTHNPKTGVQLPFPQPVSKMHGAVIQLARSRLPTPLMKVRVLPGPQMFHLCVAQSGRVLGLEPSCREFESLHADHCFAVSQRRCPMFFFIGLVVGAFVGWLIPAPAWAIRVLERLKGL